MLGTPGFLILKRKSNLDAISVMLYELNTVTIKTVTASGIRFIFF